MVYDPAHVDALLAWEKMEDRFAIGELEATADLTVIYEDPNGTAKAAIVAARTRLRVLKETPARVKVRTGEIVGYVDKRDLRKPLEEKKDEQSVRRYRDQRPGQ